MRLSTAPAAVLAAALATACQSTGPVRPESRPEAAGPVALYQYAGSRQCQPRSGKTAEQLKAELAAAGVNAESVTCGRDGRMYSAECGGGDGRILVAKVAPGDAARARSAGLKPLAELPEATSVPCR